MSSSNGYDWAKKHKLLNALLWIAVVAYIMQAGGCNQIVNSYTLESNFHKVWPLVLGLGLPTFPPLYLRQLRDYLNNKTRVSRVGSWGMMAFCWGFFWFVMAPGICMRLDFYPDDARKFDTIVLERKLSWGMRRSIVVQDDQGQTHNLRMRENYPEVGKPVVFNAREGLLGVLYDIEYVKY